MMSYRRTPRGRAFRPRNGRVYRRKSYKKRTLKRTRQYSSNSTGGGGLQYKKKRFNPKRFIRSAYKASDDETKYRSVGCNTINSTVPTVLGTINLECIQAVPDNFMLSAGGVVLGTGSVTTDDEWAPRIFVRGGQQQITFCSRLANATNVKIRLWLVQARNVAPVEVNNYFTATGGPSTFDPTSGFVWYQVIRAPTFHSDKILEPGDAWTVEQRIRPFSYPQWQSQQASYLSNMHWWVWTLEPTQVAAQALVDIVYGHNLTFSGDLNGGAY